MGRIIQFNPAYKQFYDVRDKDIPAELGSHIVTGIYTVYVYPVTDREGYDMVVVTLSRDGKLRTVFEHEGMV